MNDAIRLEVPRIGPEGYDPLFDKDDGHHFDRRGNRITPREWTGLWALREDYRIVKQEHIGDYFVSTVWTGLDHSFGHGAPLIFETMVFNESYPEMAPLGEEQPEMTSASDLDMERYSTEEQALAGHQAMVNKVRLFVAIEKGEQQ